MVLEALKQYAIDTYQAQADKPPKIEPAGGLLEGGEGNTTTKSKNPAEGLKTASTGLQIEADQTRAEKERTAAIHSEYQSNIKASGQLQAEITKGVLQGESVYTLFLKAAKAISCMTGNTLFYKQLEGDIKTIYGEGLLEPAPLVMEIEAIKDRLQALYMSRSERGKE